MTVSGCPDVSDRDGAWLFGYGSLIWRPGFEYLERAPAHVAGLTRRFWQGSHDHRGVPEAPGRVVTLVPATGERTGGMAYRIASEPFEAIVEALDHREKNGYERRMLPVELRDGRIVKALTYYAVEGNFAWLGPAPMVDIAAQISIARGPSGRNVDYLRELARSLRELRMHDAHVFELEAALAEVA